jgi:uncharacterized surface protein with fasciclin (FAS1) repeats
MLLERWDAGDPEPTFGSKYKMHTGRFWTLKQVTDKAGLTETLVNGGPFTVFAPTNEAFARANISADDNGLPAEALKKVREYR